MPLPPQALKNIQMGLQRLQANPAAGSSITHFKIVRLGGEKGVARVVFGKKYADCSDAKVKTTYAGDATVAGTAATDWFRVRGAVRISPDGQTELIPSTKETRVFSGAAMLPHFRALKKALADEKAPTQGLQKLLDATPKKAEDISRLFDGAAGEEPDSDEPAADAPSDDATATLGLNAGAAVRDTDALAHAKQFRALMADIDSVAKDPRRASGEEADRKPMRDALTRMAEQLLALSRGIEGRRRALAGALLGTTRHADSIALLEELHARAEVAAGRIEELLESVERIATAADVPVAAAADAGVAAAAPPQPASTKSIRDQLTELGAVTKILAEAAEALVEECDALEDRDPSDAGLSDELGALRGQLDEIQTDLETYSGQIEAIQAIPGAVDHPKFLSVPSNNLKRVRQALQNSTRAIAAAVARIAAEEAVDAPPRAPASERLKEMEDRFTAALEPYPGNPVVAAALKPAQKALNELWSAARKHAGPLPADMGEAEDGADEDRAHAALDEAEARFSEIDALRAEVSRLKQAQDEYLRLLPIRRSLEDDLGASPRPPWLSNVTTALADLEHTIVTQLSAGRKTFLDFKFVANVEKFSAGVNAIVPHIGKGDAIRVVSAKHTRITQLLAMRPGDYAHFSDHHQALTRALAAWDAGLQAADVATAGQLAATLVAACEACDQAQRARGVSAVGDASPTGRRAFEALCAGDPGLAASVAATRDGRDAMDNMVTGFRGMISDAADRNLVKTIMKARFGLDQLEGDLSRKSLPRLYEVFKMVPADHTHSNPRLKAVVRRRNYEPTSDYAEGDRDEKVDGVDLSAGSIVLNGVRSGGLKGWVGDKLASALEVTKYREVKGQKSLNLFNSVTLHEIGHAVDADQRFMEELGDDPAYGGWRKETPQSVARAIGTALNLFKDFAQLDETVLTTLLKEALTAPEASFWKRVPKFSAKTALAATTIPAADQGRLAGHAAFSRCQALKAEQEVWSSASKAQKLALGDRVYLQAYPGDASWYSYEVAALASRVTDYQFRAPGEWFSEAYAAYFEGKLPDSHVLTPWLEAQKRLDDPSPRP